MVAVLVLLALVLVRLLVMGALAWVLIPAGRTCPACGAETVALQRTGALRWLPGIARRWCVDCGWSWFRRQVASRPAARLARAAGRSSRVTR